MPEISRFLGIIITMYYNDHEPAHFHARYGSHRAKISISEPEIFDGTLPRRASAAVLEWTELHRSALLRNWERALKHEPLEPVEPLE